MPGRNGMIEKSFLINFWKKRSKLEKRFLITIKILILIIIIFIITICLIASKKVNNQASLKTHVCMNENCRIRGAELKRWINHSVDPCDDFYHFCCDGWLEENTPPSKFFVYDVMNRMESKVSENVKEILLNTSVDRYTPRPVNQSLIFYQACTDLDSIESRDANPLLDLLKNIGGWPIISENWNGRDYDWIEVITELVKRMASGYIIRFIVSPDVKNTSYNIVQLDKPSFSMDAKVFLDSENEEYQRTINGYKTHIRNIALLLNATGKNLDEDIDNIVDFEKSLTLMVSNTVLEYSKTSIKEFRKMIPNFPLLHYLQLITNETLKLHPMTTDDIIIIRDIKYFEKLFEFMKDSGDIEKKRKIANYLGWRVIEKQMQHLPEKFQKEFRRFNNVSKDSVLDRWEFCMLLTKVSFSYALAYSYIQRFYRTSSNCDARQIIDEFKISFSNIINTRTWMDQQTKREALKKIESLQPKIAYPDWIVDKRSLTEFYANMADVTNDPFTNDLIISEFTSFNLVKTIRKQAKLDDWTMMPLSVNAAYNRNQNSITVPAAFLQIPFYNWKLPKYLNYAAIGVVIGHEMTHGFDTEGSERDADGNVRNWWTEKSKLEFENRTKCFVEQYDSYGINGTNTLAENIADGGGLSQAYLTFKTWKAEQDDIEVLPGLENYTPEQIFFLNYCSIWCTHYNSNSWNYTVSKVDHSPSIYRVWGTISNMKEFSEAFKCKKTKRMNRSKKCSLW